MKRTIRGIDYDTETATLVHRHASGIYGDPAGYEETLYQTEDGKYFVYANGGVESPYPAEKLTCIAKSKVEAWLDAHGA